jgi:hypothetical protein
MFVVQFLENKNLLLTQLLNRVPSVGEDISIKGKKGKVSSVNYIDERNIQVYLFIEKVKEKKLILDNSKKKKRYIIRLKTLFLHRISVFLLLRKL